MASRPTLRVRRHEPGRSPATGPGRPLHLRHKAPPAIRPEDFPRGFAETDGRSYGWRRHYERHEQDPSYVIPPEPDFHPLMFDPKPGMLYDVGIDHYGEFITGLETGWNILHRETFTLNGTKGTVSVVYRFANGVQLKWRPL